MSRPLLLTLDAPEALTRSLGEALAAEFLSHCWRHFPDGESYLRIEGDCMGRDCIVVAGLSPPDPRIFPLWLAADTLRDLGARRIGLIAPYLPYLRQDTRFQAGEAVSSRAFARLLCQAFDWLATVDPHLHRYHTLNEIYTIPSLNCSASPVVAKWIREHVEKPVLLGPDAESAQWVETVAAAVPADCLVLEKTRRGDHEVEVQIPDVEHWRGHTPVLVDDIISTARTLVETLGHLQRAGLPPAVCIGTHAVFAGDGWETLQAAGPARIVTCNTIEHASNEIDIAPLLASAVLEHGLADGGR